MSILSAIGLNVTVFDRGDSGVPTTSIAAQLADRITEYSQSIADQFGFESMSCSFAAAIEEALDWLTNRLGCACVVYGPDAETVWEGRLITVEAQFGQERRSVSLDGMANRVRVRYTTVLGTPGVTATASNTTSQTLYGTKDTVLSLGSSDSTEAGAYRDAMLARLQWPVSAPSTDIATGDLGDVRVTLSFEGWYGALGDVATSNTSTTKTSTTDQIGTLLTAYNAVNNFFSTSTQNIVASGVTATEYIAPDTSYREKIETLLQRGNGANPYAWGVYEDREFYADVYAGATPDTITYLRQIGTADIHDSAGGLAQPWNVRPNAMYQVVELLDVMPTSGAKDSAARFYVARVALTVNESGYQLTLEPSEPQDLSSILVTKYPS